MTMIAAHLSVEALRDRYVSSAEVCEARHFQTIWLLAKGHSVGEVAEMTSFGCRWIEQLVVRYNAEGLESLGDLRRRNGATASVLKPEVLDKLRVRLKEPPDDGGLWTSAKVAAFIKAGLGSRSTYFAKKAVLTAEGRWTTSRCRSCSPSPRKPRNIPNGRSRSSRATSIGSA